MSRVGAIILAAGASNRLGTPKQLLRLPNGATLLSHTIGCALAADCHPVVVVLGANLSAITAEIAEPPVQVVMNEEWEEGMASSIRRGIEALLHDATVQATLLLVCDQPLLSGAVLADLIAQYRESGLPIVASEYGEAVGVPCVFDRTVWVELTGLRGNEGAKRITARYQTKGLVGTVPFPGGAFDIDTAGDWKQLQEDAKENSEI